jgi:hypothetical protein
MRVRATASSASRATSTFRNATHQFHRCILFRHARQSWPFITEQSMLQLPVARTSTHTFLKERERNSVCSSSLSNSALQLQPLHLQLRWKTRSSYFSTHTHTDATITHVDTDIAPADANTSIETTSCALLSEGTSSFDSPTSLSTPSSPHVDEDTVFISTETTSISPLDDHVSSFNSTPSSSPLLKQPVENKDNVVEPHKAMFDDSGMTIPEITKRYIQMNVAESSPSKQDLERMRTCMQLWRKIRTLEAWKNSCLLYEQLILSLKQQEHNVLEEWYRTNREPNMTQLLNGLLEQWYLTRKKGHPRHSQSDPSTLGPTPSQMLDQLSTWKTMEPMLLLVARTLNQIMQAAIDDNHAKEAPLFCESLFRSMLPTQSSSSSSCAVDQRTLPDAFTYTLVLKAWSKRTGGSLEATEHLWNLFSEIQQLHKDGILEAPLNAIHYTILIDGFTRTKQITWINRAEQLFQQMEESPTLTPTRGTYVAYLVGWLSYIGLTLEQWHRCKVVLNKALEQSKASPQDPLVNASMFSRFMVTACALKRDDLAELTFVELCEWYNRYPVPSMVPDGHCLKALLQMYIRTLRPKLAEQILLIVIKEVHGKNNFEWVPTAQHFDQIIRCWLQQTVPDEDGLERAGQLFLQALELDKELRLDISDESLYEIIFAWAQSRRHDGPSRASALLKAFQSQSRKPVRSACLQLVEKMQSPSFQQKLKQRQPPGDTN